MIDWPKTEGKLRATMFGLQKPEASVSGPSDCWTHAALHHSHVSEKQLAPAREDLVRLAQGRCGSWSILSVSSLASTACSNQFCSPTDVRTSATTWTAAYAFSRL